MPTRCNTVFIADLIACWTCFEHHYAHHQQLKSIIHENHGTKYYRQQPLYNTLELLMMGIVVLRNMLSKQ